MKTLFNYGKSKIVVRINDKPFIFLPNSALTVDDETSAFLLKLNQIQEINTQTIQPTIVEEKKPNKTDEIIQDIIKEEKATKKPKKKKKEE